MVYATEVLKDNPRGYWRLGETSGETVNDETANNMDGTYVNAPTLGVPGVITDNTAASFQEARRAATEGRGQGELLQDKTPASLPGIIAVYRTPSLDYSFEAGCLPR